jgi:hypothetical protein
MRRQREENGGSNKRAFLEARKRGHKQKHSK